MNDVDRSIPSAEAFEGLGTFYLGILSPSDEAPSPSEEAGERAPFLYDARDLTTHAVVLGMTGSGKTGLCITLLEEAALDGVPAIAIDLKGDIANLMLLFPDLAPEDFRPWIDEAEAARKNRTPEEHAEAVATTWRDGLAGDGQDGDRIGRLLDAVDMTIYTPGGTHGRPLAVLRSFAAPPAAVRDDADAFGDRVQSAVSGLLTLIGEAGADPLRSREHILLSRILADRWAAGDDLDLPGLIRSVQDPGFDRVGVLDLDSFYPADDRFELATRLNHLVAAPGFDVWLQGAPLDVGSLLWTDDGTPRVSIVSVAHLDDAERMFFLTMLLNEIVAWVRTQPGTGSLRALLYIDEVFGYLPPTANPPTKPPLLTLLKQARAFGFGVVLATQNPVDLDYKALGNAGTWCLGRLQTERDKDRVLDGLASIPALSGGDAPTRTELDDLLSGLDSRQFLVNNVHEDGPVRIRSRWAMSYLRGPLARPEIARLAGSDTSADEGAAGTQSGPERTPVDSADTARPLLPPDVDEVFVAGGDGGAWRPALLGKARLHYTKRGTEIDHWEEVHCLSVPVDEDRLDDPWAGATVSDEPPEPDAAAAGDVFAPVPPDLLEARTYRTAASQLETWLYRERRLSVWTCDRLDMESEPGEAEGAFRRRVREAGRDARDEALDKLRERYATRLRRARDRIETAEAAVDREAAQYEQHRSQSFVRLGSSVLGAFLGRKSGLSRTDLSKLSTAANSFGRTSKQKDDVERAEDKVAGLRESLAGLESDLETELEEARAEWSPEALDAEIVVLEISPRKSDLEAGPVRLAWTRG